MSNKLTQKSQPLPAPEAWAPGSAIRVTHYTADQMRKAIEDEREACAALADSYDGARQNMADVIAEAIRQRGKQ